MPTKRTIPPKQKVPSSDQWEEDKAWAEQREREREALKLYEIDKDPTFPEIKCGLTKLLETDANFGKLKDYIDKNRAALLYHVNCGHQGFVIPKRELRTSDGPDYVIATQCSSGLDWQSISLCDPHTSLQPDNGKVALSLRKAIKATALAHNDLPGLRELRVDLGLGGLSNEGFVIASRRRLLTIDSDHSRNQFAQSYGVHIHTYDWLLDQVSKPTWLYGVKPLIQRGEGLRPYSLTQYVELGRENLRLAAIAAGVERPNKGQHHFQYPPRSISLIARERKKLGADDKELQEWDELLKGLGQPPRGAKLPARRRKN